MRRAALRVLLAACGDNLDEAVPLPPALVAQFLSIGTAATVDEARYDPRGDQAVTLTPVSAAASVDGAWLVTDGGARLRLAPCDAVDDCAAL